MVGLVIIVQMAVDEPESSVSDVEQVIYATPLIVTVQDSVPEGAMVPVPTTVAVRLKLTDEVLVLVTVIEGAILPTLSPVATTAVVAAEISVSPW
jgi:hypothetical protein